MNARWNEGFVFLGALVFCTCAVAQGGGWAAVQGIPGGSRVEVRLVRSGNVKGRLVSVSASGMEVQTSGGSTRNLDRGQIAKVYLVGKSHKLRDGLIGAGVGGAGGSVYGVAEFNCAPNYYNGGCHNGLSTIVVGAIAAVIGAAVGAVIGLRHGKTLVYRRESTRRPGDPKSAGQKPKAKVEAARRSLVAGGLGHK